MIQRISLFIIKQHKPLLFRVQFTQLCSAQPVPVPYRIAKNIHMRHAHHLSAVISLFHILRKQIRLFLLPPVKCRYLLITVTDIPCKRRPALCFLSQIQVEGEELSEQFICFFARFPAFREFQHHFIPVISRWTVYEKSFFLIKFRQPQKHIIRSLKKPLKHFQRKTKLPAVIKQLHHLLHFL